MNDRQAFLNAILADPDDDTVRLVFADWLEEQSDPSDRDRARFIRLQIEQTRSDDDDRCRELGAECDQLLEAHRQEWAHDFKVEFERGFVSIFYLSAADLKKKSLDVFLDREPIWHFVLSEVQDFPPSFARWEHLPRVRELTFSTSLGGGRETVTTVLQSPLLNGLEGLRVQDFLTVEDVCRLAEDARFSALRRLNLSFSLLAPEALLAIATSRVLTNLNSLEYSLNDVSDEAFAALVASPIRDRLTHLGLSRYEGFSHRLGSWAAEGLAEFSRLESLDLNLHCIGDGVATLADSPRSRNLRVLNLTRNGLTPAGVRTIFASPHLSRLEDLDLTGNGGGPEWAESLARSPHRAVRRLKLDDDEIDAAAASLIAEAPISESLRELSLYLNPLGDCGAIALAGSRRLRRLSSLSLCNCGIGDAGAIALAESPLLDQLTLHRSLVLTDNPFSDEVARRLEARLGYNPGVW